jgi:hypothetical protein
MSTGRGALSGNAFSKVVFGLGVMLLALAPPAARPGAAAEVYDFQFCRGYFALCAASPCTPKPGQTITVRTAAGGTAVFPAADCTCPVILGVSIANLAGGNMQGSCEPPADQPGTIWSTFQPRPNIPQALTNWVPTPPEAAAPPLFCPKSPPLGNQLVNCFSFLCDSLTYIPGTDVPVATCHCPIGESLAGTPVPPATAFLTQAGQGDPAYCAMHPVSGPLSIP